MNPPPVKMLPSSVVIPSPFPPTVSRRYLILAPGSLGGAVRSALLNQWSDDATAHVDVWNFATSGLPTLSILLNYRAIFLGRSLSDSWQVDTVTLGNRLAEAADESVGIVMTAFVWTTQVPGSFAGPDEARSHVSLDLICFECGSLRTYAGGNFLSQGFYPLPVDAILQSQFTDTRFQSLYPVRPRTLGSLLVPQHAVLNGISSYTSTGAACNSGAVASALVRILFAFFSFVLSFFVAIDSYCCLLFLGSIFSSDDCDLG